ncbi:hypothetical protein [Nocardiopsis kunsanensis]|uniref:hypothetical protein n=1 Tax=Nocardiopsis kunsanensis TaxID=141693 RepID=UPI001E2B07BB|nr:hypothetical protein [Nocardiopsis kunsanensis]
MCTVLVRLLRPTRGIHTSPSGYLRELGAELRRRRSGRVRRYVADMPAALATDPTSYEPPHLAPAPDRNEHNAPTPHVPAPRRPSDDRPSRAFQKRPSHGAPVPQYDPDDLARAYLRAHEHRALASAQRRADRTRLGVAVLCDIAGSCTA